MNLHYGVLVGVLSQPDFEQGKHTHLYIKPNFYLRDLLYSCTSKGFEVFYNIVLCTT